MTAGDAPGEGSGEAPGDESEDDRGPEGERPPCDEAGCTRPAGVVLHVPWDEDRAVCPAHARVLARPDGVVAEPIEGAETEWP